MADLTIIDENTEYEKRYFVDLRLILRIIGFGLHHKSSFGFRY